MALALLALLLPIFADAQPSTRGTEFWFTFMQSLRWPVKDIPPDMPLLMRVSILADRGATCVVEMPGIAWSTTLVVPPAGVATVTLPSWIEYPYDSDSVQALGVHVRASDSVTVLALNFIEGSADATIVLPVDQLGDDYVVSAFDALVENGEQFYPSEFAIVAVEDETAVEIIPRVTTAKGRAAGVPYTVTLNRGEVYQVQAWENLAGSRVRGVEGASCRRFALFGGSVLTLIGGCEAGDHLYEQMLPVDHWGKEFFTVPLATRSGGDVFEIVADSNGTVVVVHGGPPVTLDAGGVFRVQLEAPGSIRANKRIAVAQFARGGECDGNAESDPLMVMLPPIGRAIARASWLAFDGLVFSRHFVNVVVPSAAAASVRIDGVPFAATFAPFATDPAWSWAQIQVAAGPHVMTAAEPFIAWAYGFAHPVSYGFACGLSFEPPPVYSFDVTSPTGTFCAGEPVEFIEQTDGTPRPLEWDFGDGTVQTGSRPRHVFDSAGTYVVRLRARVGRSCAGESVERRVVIDARPPMPEIAADCGCDSVRLAAPGGYTRYLWSTGETSSTIELVDSATVSLSVWNAEGCETTTPPHRVNIPSRSRSIEFELERTVAAAGEIVPIRMRLAHPPSGVLCRSPLLRVTISHSSTILALDYVHGGEIVGDTIISGRRHLTIAPDCDSLLLELKAGLGSDSVSTIVIESRESEDCWIAAGDTIGVFALAGICREGGVRLFLDSEPATLKPVHPNPVRGEVTVEFTLMEEGATTLALHDSYGRRVRVIVDGTMRAGPGLITFSAAALSSGQYYLVLTTPSSRVMRGLRVAR